MANPIANLAMDGGDPRMSDNGQGIAEFSRRQLHNAHDPSILIEEYLHYARITRKEEEGLAPAKHPLRKLAGFGLGKKDQTDFTQRRASVNMPSTEPGLSEKAGATDKQVAVDAAGHEKEMTVDSGASPTIVTDEEWMQAARAGRTATWGAVFYLITTDILGPTSAPWALQQMGFGMGISLYAVFGALAGYGGWLLWKMFLNLDSNQYPLKTYGDIAYRIYGNKTRHFMSGLQSLQLIFNVGVIVVGNGQGIYQINSNICFIVCCVIWVAIGMVLGQIRTLQRFGWLANLAIWMNVVVMIITMAAVSHEVPNYLGASTEFAIPAGMYTFPLGTGSGPPPPVMTTAGPGAGVAFEGQVVGLMQAVFAYGGAMIFCEFMSEMRKPHDFWKGMLAAQSFIFCAYVFFGAYVYGYQGQYVLNPANQGISRYSLQTATNVLSNTSGLLAAALYGNIGIKVIYQNLLKDVFGFPDLTARGGKLIWIAIVPVYWAIAFVIAAGIPSFSNLSGLIAALCILHFSYTFPPILIIGYNTQVDAIQEGEGFDPATNRVIRHDNGLKRWIRGYKKQMVFNSINFIYFLGACVTSLLGIYSSCKGLAETLGSPGHGASSFSCQGPV